MPILIVFSPFMFAFAQSIFAFGTFANRRHAAG
jgi:hypothetical protein